MGSKKEEERNEKIIRGLMKLPPNRRCLNCNSLGPQYVCTNFWSFVCITCSGIHREFTHRVKSVSMAKFTSQEVEALQNGGNQRARDIYLKDWDLQRQRLPDSSNVDKIRQFIKDVYVDKKYAGGKTSEKPPRDTQNRGIREDETRRASSYHSYSQSPPYDYQYEDRRYGKQAASLTRKPGSDRGRYEGKMSSFVYSPGSRSEQMYDDRFANEGSISRVSDFSVSSGGDPLRSGTQSPNFQKDVGFSSPPFHLSRGGSSEDVRHHSRDSFPQRSRSSGSFGSIDGNFMSQSSFNSSSEQGGGIQDRPPPGSALPGSSGSLDLFEAQTIPEKSSSAAPIDLFQLPEAPAALPVDLFQSPAVSTSMPTNAFQPTQASLTSLDLFAATDQPQPSATSNEKLPDYSSITNEGWATFDVPQSSAPTTSNEKLTPAVISSDGGGGSLGNLDFFSSLDTSTQWPSTQDSSFGGPLNISSVWDDNSQGVTPPNATNTQFWNAFEDSQGHQPLGDINHGSGLLVGTDEISSTANQHLGLTSSQSAGLDSFCWAASHSASSGPISSSLVTGTEYAQTVVPLVGESEPPSTDRKSNNPFDLPYDSELEENNVFLDMTSLQAALPNSQLPSGFLGDVSEPWFPQNSAPSYLPSAGQGGVTYLAPQVPSSQIPNVSTQEPVASSIGGNPFA